MKKTAIVGCGNMGSAIFNAMLKSEKWAVNQLVVIEKIQNSFVDDFISKGVKRYQAIDEFPGNFEIVILAVKPQSSADVLEELASKVDSNTLVISIMAGISLSGMEKVLPNAQIVRCMPNTPCSIHLGMTVYCGNNAVSQKGFDLVQGMLETMGKAFMVVDEQMIDATTAISGSGPAYLFYFAEAMRDGAMKLGFNADQALILANQTLLGASTLLVDSGENPEDLRKKVTSPGGTTEAALNSFQKNDLNKKLIEGFKAAFDRSIELGKF